MSKIKTVKRSEFGRLRMAAGNERKYNSALTGGEAVPSNGVVGG